MIENLIGTGLALGADFVDVFREETRRAAVSLKDQKVESASAGIDFGYGIRMIKGKQTLYVESSYEDEGKLTRMMKNLVATHGWQKKDEVTTINYLRGVRLENVHKILKEPAKVGQSPKLAWLSRLDQLARARSPKIRQVSASAFDETQNVTIANSEGLMIEDRRVRCRLNFNVTASEGDQLFTGGENPGAMMGMEFFDSLDLEDLANKAADRAMLMLNAGYIDGRCMPVVIGSGFGGVIFHEACGHPLETEAIRKKASPFVGKIGELIAHPAVTAIDDGTLPGVWGSIQIDDEGMPTEKTMLIEKGILKDYLSDRLGAGEVGRRRTGSARRESFHYVPVSRMRNTYIDRGDDNIEDMVSSISYGLYAKVMGGGSVNPATGEFNFSVQEGYEIKNGKIGRPVRGATLIGKGHEILPKISMVANDLEMAAGMCGASSGSVPVTVGQPTIKVDDILVGGR